MASGYGQYCPLSLAAEVLGERWSILVVSRLIDGCSRFNEIHRGLPRMSASLLSRRLSQLEDHGVIERKKLDRGPGYAYFLTEAGRSLEPIVDSLAVWGHQWARDMTKADLDPRFLLWSMHLRLDTGKMPEGRTVIAFEFSGAPEDCRRFWIINDAGRVEMCIAHPGFEIDLTVRSDLLVFVEAWRGFRDLRDEIRMGRIELNGPPRLKKSFPAWLLLSFYARYPRQRPGRERRLSRRR